jgi:hypothetical protein
MVRSYWSRRMRMGFTRAARTAGASAAISETVSTTTATTTIVDFDRLDPEQETAYQPATPIAFTAPATIPVKQIAWILRFAQDDTSNRRYIRRGARGRGVDRGVPAP